MVLDTLFVCVCVMCVCFLFLRGQEGVVLCVALWIVETKAESSSAKTVVHTCQVLHFARSSYRFLKFL